MARNVVLLIARQPGQKPTVYDLLVERITVGRDPSCDIVLDSSQEISRTHLELVFRDGSYTLVPKGSLGTRYRGKLLTAPHPIAHGDKIELPGKVELEVVVCASEKRARVVERITAQSAGGRSSGIRLNKGLMAYFAVIGVLFVALAVSGTGGGKQSQRAERRDYYVGPPDTVRDQKGKWPHHDPVQADTVMPRGGQLLHSALGFGPEFAIDWSKGIDEQQAVRMLKIAKGEYERDSDDPGRYWRYLLNLTDIMAISAKREQSLADLELGGVPQPVRDELLVVRAALKRAADDALRSANFLRAKGMWPDAAEQYRLLARLVPDRAQYPHMEAQRSLREMRKEAARE